MSDVTNIDARSGRIMYKNTSGDTTLFYPETTAEKVYISETSTGTVYDELETLYKYYYSHTDNTTNPHKVTAEQVGALSSTPISMASTDGAAYTCTVPGIASLTAGASFIGIPAIVSTSTSVTLNVNNLGAKQLRRGVSTSSSTTTAGYNESWLAAGKPLRIMYDGLFWIVDNARPYAADLMGTVPIANGGTGATDGATGLANLFAAGSTVLSSNQYGETLPTAGSAGRVFFKKSDGSDMEAINAHISDENNPHKVTAAQVGALSSTPIDMLSDDGVTYTCTVPWITELTPGVCFIGIPNKTSTSIDAKLNVNNLGDAQLRVRSTRWSSGSVPYSKSWLWEGNPVIFICVSSGVWIAEGGTIPNGVGYVERADYASVNPVGTPALRNEYFVSAEATPTVNGQIAWVYG